MDRGQTVCRRCGYYPALNTFVEVDPIEDATAGPNAAAPAKSHLEVWKSLIPRWARWLLAGVAVLLAVSIAARIAVPAGSGRAVWTYAQFGVGVIAVIVAHIASYMAAIMVNDTLSFIDILLKPVAIWSVAWHDLPKSFKRVALGSWGLSAALFAAFVVGGVRYNEIIDWGQVPAKKKKSRKAVTAPIEAPAEEMSLEEAMEEFADQAGADMSAEERERQRANRQKTAKCLIIGFTPHRESDFDSLLLAVDEGGGHWRFAGAMREGCTVEARSTLNRRMRASLRQTPVVPCDLKAFWLQPKLMCTVWFEDWTEDGRLKRPFFEKLASDFEPAKTTAK
jgi:hypothetical protein